MPHSDRLCLIIDDEPSIRSYLSALLKREQAETLEAETVVEGIEIIQRVRGKLSLVVSDIKTPGNMDGIDLAYSVHNSFPNLPVILISGYMDRPPLPNTVQFIRKPFNPEVILSAIRRVMPKAEA